MTTISISDKFNNQRSFPTRHPFFRPRARLFHSEYIHTVNLQTWDLVASGEILGVH